MLQQVKMTSTPPPDNLTKELTAFSYKYKCDGLLYPWTGTRNFIHKPGKEPEKEAEEDAQRTTGANKCSVALLQKFYMSVRLAEPYEALIQFPTQLN